MGIQDASATELSTLDRCCRKIATLTALAAKVLLLVLRLFSTCFKDRPPTVFDILAVVMEVSRPFDLSPFPVLRGRPNSKSRPSNFQAVFPMLKRSNAVYEETMGFVGLGEATIEAWTARSTLRGGERAALSTLSSRILGPSGHEDAERPATGKTSFAAFDLDIPDSNDCGGEDVLGCLSWESGRTEMMCWPARGPQAFGSKLIGDLVTGMEESMADSHDDFNHGPDDETALSKVSVQEDQDSIQLLQRCHLRETYCRHSLGAITQVERYTASRLAVRQKRPKPPRRCFSWPVW